MGNDVLYLLLLLLHTLILLVLILMLSIHQKIIYKDSLLFLLILSGDTKLNPGPVYARN